MNSAVLYRSLSLGQTLAQHRVHRRLPEEVHECFSPRPLRPSCARPTLAAVHYDDEDAGAGPDLCCSNSSVRRFDKAEWPRPLR